MTNPASAGPRPFQLRRSQLISVFGPGSVVDLERDSGMPMGIHHWPPGEKSDIIYEERLQRALRVTHFRMPPPFVEGERTELLPLVKFPTYHYCPSCGLLTNDFARPERRKDGVRCPKCNERMTPARFIEACVRGHAQDFPFREWVHRGTVCNRLLHQRTLGTSAGLRDVVIECECGMKRSMEGSFGENSLVKIGLRCPGLHPWKSAPPEDCDEHPQALQRGAANFYFAETRSSLSIPPWDSKIGELLTAFRHYSGGVEFDPDDPDHRAAINLNLKRIPGTPFSLKDVVNWAKKNRPGSAGYDPQRFKSEEYEVFCRVKSGESDRPRFRVREVTISEEIRLVVSQIILADVLEEVRAQVGFRRVSPWSPVSTGAPEGNLVELRMPNLDWLPAVRVTGEGIFLRFDAQKLSDWAKNKGMVARATELQSRIDSAVTQGKARPNAVRPTPDFLFLHSFAHIVMAQLSLDCGYSSGALRERIYSGEMIPPSSHHMSGVLIYTGSTDSEGTLGGLVRMGEPDSLGHVILRALHRAAWCSSDPICSETKNPGERTMNLCACHACLFVPETSCEFFNSLLDRQAIVGDLSLTGGFLSSLL